MELVSCNTCIAGLERRRTYMYVMAWLRQAEVRTREKGERVLLRVLLR